MNNTQALGYVSYGSEVVSDHSAFISGYMAMASPVSRRYAHIPILVSLATKVVAEILLRVDSQIKSVYEKIRPESFKFTKSGPIPGAGYGGMGLLMGTNRGDQSMASVKCNLFCLVSLLTYYTLSVDYRIYNLLTHNQSSSNSTGDLLE